jgi:hypothetical protein
MRLEKLLAAECHMQKGVHPMQMVVTRACLSVIATCKKKTFHFNNMHAEQIIQVKLDNLHHQS